MLCKRERLAGRGVWGALPQRQGRAVWSQRTIPPNNLASRHEAAQAMRTRKVVNSALADRGRVARPFGFALTDPGGRISRTRLFPEVTRIEPLGVSRDG